jgi:chorismate mutase / prephenate dehydratase
MTAHSTAAGPSRTLGALGGAQTFGGQAATAFTRRYPELGHVAFLASSAELFADDGRWRADAACVPAYTSQAGPHLNTHRRLIERGDLYVLAEDYHAYHCALLVRPDTRLPAIRRVLGHTGSVTQSRPWLERNLPDAEIHIVDSHSLGAGREVLAAGGDTAAVGSLSLAAELGLVVLARDIDGGSIGCYWALASELATVPKPNRVVVTGRTRDGAGLSALVDGLSQAGFQLVSLNQVPVGDGLFHDGCVAYFTGRGSADTIRQTVADSGFRLAGAYAVRCSA